MYKEEKLVNDCMSGTTQQVFGRTVTIGATFAKEKSSNGRSGLSVQRCRPRMLGNLYDQVNRGLTMDSGAG